MALITLAFLFCGAYFVYLGIHRLFLSPLVNFPGPKLAALSGWYEAYFDIVLRGQFEFHIAKLHKRYGPIVRVTPTEVHIKDSAFWDEVFVRRPKASKHPSVGIRFGNNDSIFAVTDAADHRRLRAPLNPFFSRRAILDQQPLVQEKVQLLCQGFNRCRSNGSIFNVIDAFAAFTSDVVSQYAFGFSYDQIKKDGWKDNFHGPFVALGEFAHIALQVPWIAPLLESFPDNLVAKSSPDFEKMLRLRRDNRETIERIRHDLEKSDRKETDSTIFHALLQSDLPDSDKTTARLGHEAQTFFGAGVVTTAWALTNAVFYILSDPEKLSKLRAELNEAIPNVSAANAFNYEKLERLPYLTGCIKEGIRLSYGLSGRITRVFNEPLVYKDWTIPPNTAVSMSITDVSFDETIFESPRQYKPERWFARAPKPADGSSLENYFVPFSKGPRMCLGITLAYLEQYVVLAHIFRRFSLELYETDVSDVEVAHDFFIPSPRLDSKGVRVKVIEAVA